MLIFAGFLVIAGILFSGIVAAWRAKPKGQLSYAKLIGITAFLALWFGLISVHYLNGLRFHYQLRQLQASGIYSVQIGRHDSRDRAAIEEIVGALRQSHWFEVNHGGWGDSIPLTLHRVVRQSHNVEVLHACRSHVHLHLNEVGVNPVNRSALGFK